MSHVTMSHVTNSRKKAMISLTEHVPHVSAEAPQRNFGGSAANVGNDIAVELFCVFRRSEASATTHVDTDDKGRVAIRDSAYEPRVVIINESP